MKSKKIISILALAVSSAALSKSAFANNMTVHIINNSGQNLFIDVVPSSTGNTLNFKSGKFENSFTPGLNSPNIKEIPVSTNNTPTTISIPSTGFPHNGRIYISTHPFNGQMSGVKGQPDLATYQYVYDKIEMSPNGVWNTTSVDFFGMPIQIKLTGQSDDKAVGYQSGITRAAVITALEKAMDKEQELYGDRFFKTGDNSNIVRIFSPQHFYTSFPANNPWDVQIISDLKALIQNYGDSFDFNYGGFQYKGLSYDESSNQLTTTNQATGATITLSKITAANASAGKISFTGGDAGGKFAGMISAAINRGVLADPSHWGENGEDNQGFPQYYYQGEPGHYKYNTYAATLIKNFGINQKLYADSYDDFWKMDSSLGFGPANYKEGVTITILPFN